MNILVVGGGGYIGSHMVKMLASRGYEVTTFDNFSTGYRDAVVAGRISEGDMSSPQQLDAVFSNSNYDCVMHFASFIEVGESVRMPGKYYSNNFTNTMSLLDAMLRHGVNRFIFSSTAAIFGEPRYTPIDEEHEFRPVNPYGKSKYMVELMLQDYERAFGLKSSCLRYFNAAGADPEGELGERHNPESHLIPLVLQAASGRRKSISIFGNDYETPDGTCVRDYVHVQDLCEAHILTLEQLLGTGESTCFNLGNGQGFSVQQIIDLAREVTACEIPASIEKRREGDPAILVADSTLAKKELNWEPRLSSLENIIKTAWNWERTFFSQ